MLIKADARRLPVLDGCVQCVVTSPPYWGLRDYGDPNQIGLELTPEAYLASLLTVFGEVWRVLRADGTVWLNLGDSYAGERWGQGPAPPPTNTGNKHALGMSRGGLHLKPKDLVGMPWRVAFALHAAGWYLRSDIIWSKPNPMPESVTDRPTKAHEYLFLLTKSERYVYDAAAIREPYAESTLLEAKFGYRGTATKEYRAAGVQDPSDTKKRIVETIRRRQGMVQSVRKNDVHPDHRKAGVNEWEQRGSIGAGRNTRTVWTIPTMPYAGAHFATMPEALIEPCILAGCPLGGLVLDPFIGSGTVGAVAERLGRRWIGTDLTYQSLARTRTAQRGLQW